MEVGFVARAHGIHGELRIGLHYKESDAIEQVKELWLRAREQSTSRSHPIQALRRVTSAYLVRLEGVPNRTEAERLKGATVSVNRADLPALDPGEYYLADLVAAEVWAPEGLVGTVIDIGLHPTVDSVVIKTSDGARLEQPLIDPWLKRVDAAAGRIDLHSRDGLID